MPNELAADAIEEPTFRSDDVEEETRLREDEATPKDEKDWLDALELDTCKEDLKELTTEAPTAEDTMTKDGLELFTDDDAKLLATPRLLTEI